MLALPLGAALPVGLSWPRAAVHARSAPANASPMFGVTLPPGYRDWTLISVAHEAGRTNDIRAILGNGVAVKAFRAGKRPFPGGAIIVRLAWEYRSSPRNDAVFPAPQSFVAGPPSNVQVSVKDTSATRPAADGDIGSSRMDEPTGMLTSLGNASAVTPRSA